MSTTYTQNDLKKALNKAKIQLMMQGSVFLATIAFNLKLNITKEDDPNCQTAAVDGINLFINPKFFMSLSEPVRVFVYAHEAWHMALNHIDRKNSRDHDLYNRAGDYVINQMLKESNFTLWDKALQEDKYAGLTTNQIYDILDQEKKKDPNAFNNDGFTPDIKQPKDAATAKKVKQNVKEVLVKAATQSKISGDAPGTIPGDIQRAIEELLNPVLPWDELLDRFLTEKCSHDYSWAKPNKRFAPEFYLPTQEAEGLSHLTIAVDTSGSISKDDVINILTEVQSIRDKFKPKRMTIIDCDRHINHVHEVGEYDDIMDLEFSGGGGTSFKPVIHYCNENATTALLYFTDLYANQIEKEPDYPVVWLCYSDHKPAPIGDTIYYEQYKD